MTKKETAPMILPVLSLRGLVLFPKMMLHFDVGRKKSILALNAAMQNNQSIYLAPQLDMRIPVWTTWRQWAWWAQSSRF